MALAALVASTGLAAAAGLTQEDYRYLAQTYGITSQGDVLAGLNPDEQSGLHDIMVRLKANPAQRDDAVRSRLYDAYARECQAWEVTHGQFCQPARDPAAQPGKEIADRICNQCHLFGSGMAPSFFRLAQRQRWDGAAVANALKGSHDMVPVNMPETERGQLAAYINAFH